MNKPSKLELLIQRLEQKCDSLTGAIEFHNTTLNQHQNQLDIITNNMVIRRELRNKAMDRHRAIKDRLEALKKSKAMIDNC